MRLNDDFTAELLTYNYPKWQVKEKGIWSMIYNQAFYVEFPTTKRRFSANFMYTVKDNIAGSNLQ